jgi:CubicO group peptidase (beta-lactamase class C family)
MTETYGGWETPGSGPTRQTDELTHRAGLRRDLDRLHEEIARVESELDEFGSEYPLARRVVRAADTLAGSTVGFLAAAVALLFQTVVSLLTGQHALEAVRLLLTLPLGSQALHLETGPALAGGICLWLLAGILYGVVFHAVLSGPFALAPGVWRLLAVTAMGMVLFVVHVPLLMGWIGPHLTGSVATARVVPGWQLAIDHLIFGWSILAFEGRGRGSRRRQREGEEG